MKAHNRRRRYTPGKVIRTQRALLQAAEYYLQLEGPMSTRELYPFLEDEITIKGMNPKSLGQLIGRSGLFKVERLHGERLWKLPG